MKRFLTGSFAAANRIAQSNEQLGRDIRQSNKELADRMSENSRAEIKARDRVDISLDEYEHLKKTIESLKSDNAKFRALFDRIKFPIDREIIPESIRVEWSRDPINRRRRWYITFDVDELD